MTERTVEARHGAGDAAPTDPNLRKLLDYWVSKRGGRDFPSRTDIDPNEFRYALGWIMLVDVAYEPLRFHFRLFGSELAARTNFDMTGKDLSELPDAKFRAHTVQAWEETIATRRPTSAKFLGMLKDRLVQYESLRLPLSSDGRSIDMLLVALRVTTPSW